MTSTEQKVTTNKLRIISSKRVSRKEQKVTSNEKRAKRSVS